MSTESQRTLEIQEEEHYYGSCRLSDNAWEETSSHFCDCFARLAVKLLENVECATLVTMRHNAWRNIDLAVRCPTLVCCRIKSDAIQVCLFCKQYLSEFEKHRNLLCAAIKEEIACLLGGGTQKELFHKVDTINFRRGKKFFFHDIPYLVK